MDVFKAVAHFSNGKAHLEFRHSSPPIHFRALAARRVVRLVGASRQPDGLDHVVDNASSGEGSGHN